MKDCVVSNALWCWVQADVELSNLHVKPTATLTHVKIVIRVKLLVNLNFLLLVTASNCILFRVLEIDKLIVLRLF